MAVSTTSQQQRPTPDAIIDETRAMLEEDGVEAITMRGLAARCGIGTATLYGYFRNKDELLGALADRLFAEVALPDDGLPWEERLVQLMYSIHEVLTAHPELSQIIAARPVPGGTAPQLLRVTLRALADAGLGEHDTKVAHNVLSTYTIGYTSGARARRARAPDLSQLIAETRGTAADEPVDESREFLEGLRVVIDGIAGKRGKGK